MLGERCIACASSDIPVIFKNGDNLKRCSGCGLVYRMSKGNKKEHIDAISEHYCLVDPEKKVSDSREKLFKGFLDNAFKGKSIGPRLLDIGCGSGYFLSIAQEKGWSVTGVELVSSLAEKGRKKYGINIIPGAFEETTFSENYFDVITMWNVFDAVPDPIKCIEGVKRILKEEGMLFIRTPNASFHTFIFRVSKMLKALRLDKVLPRQSFLFHRFTFSARALRFLLRKKGFSNIKTKNSPPTSGDPYNVKKGVRALKLLSYFVAQVIYFLSFGNLTISSSIEIYARQT